MLASAGVTDPHTVNFRTQFLKPGDSKGKSLYLQTSPEYAMKRLLCAQSGSIYQICKAFRNEEQGRFHNPEFTMLEWYRVGFDHWQLMDEIETLISGILDTEKFERLSYLETFRTHLRFDPINCSDMVLVATARDYGLVGLENHNRDSVLQFLFSQEIEPKIGQTSPCFIYDFPASQAALAKLSPVDPKVAERFELYYKGVELANGFNELQSVEEQKQRFLADNETRERLGIEPAKLDDKFLAALEHGLPNCAGVAMGLDRLLMLMTGADKIGEVLAFDVVRA